MKAFSILLLVALLAVFVTGAALPKPLPATPAPRPTITPTSPYCRGGVCYRPEPTALYTLTPATCNPPPGCDSASQVCAAVCSR